MNEKYHRSRITGVLLLLLSFGVWLAAEAIAVEAAVDEVETSVKVPASEVEEIEVADEQSANVTSGNRMRMLMASITIFVLAVFIGFEVITKVPPTLHTPLMSGSNAISGITVVGAILVTAKGGDWQFVAMLAVVFAMVNVVGGFLVTHRMLAMFKPKKKKAQTQE